MSIDQQTYASPSQAAEALSAAVADALRTGIAARGAGSLLVSARADLVPTFQRLCDEDLDWSRVTILPSDECWVAPSSEYSGERLLRRHLLQGAALDARLLALRTADRKPIEAVVELAERLARLDRPFDAALLSVGVEGDVAGLLPETPAVEAMLKPDWAVKIAPVTAKTLPHERVTLTFGGLLDVRQIFVLVPEAAVDAYAQAQAGERSSAIAALLRQRRAPVSVAVIAT